MLVKEKITPLVSKEIIPKQNLVITIDGNSGSGKWTLAELLADRYDLTFLNTGTSIRALALLAIEQGLVQTDDTNAVNIPVDFAERVIHLFDTLPQKFSMEQPAPGSRMARVMLGERDMFEALEQYNKRKAIENLSSIIAAIPELRTRFYEQWQDAANRFDGVVVVGRKTGDDLFPDAHLKIFLQADPEAAASNRVRKNIMATDVVAHEASYVRARDIRDWSSGLLNPPQDALFFDTSEYIQNTNGMTEVAMMIMNYFDARYSVRLSGSTDLPRV